VPRETSAGLVAFGRWLAGATVTGLSGCWLCAIAGVAASANSIGSAALESQSWREVNWKDRARARDDVEDPLMMNTVMLDGEQINRHARLP
jgi:hypothetical protein